MKYLVNIALMASLSSAFAVDAFGQSGCLSTDIGAPITWTLPRTPGTPNWTINSNGYTVGDTTPAFVAGPFSATFWRRSECPTQLLLTLDTSGSILSMGMFTAIQGGNTEPILYMVANDPSVYDQNIVPISLAGPPVGTISGVVKLSLGNLSSIDPAQALTLEFTPLTFTGPGAVVSLQIPAAVTSGPPPAFAIGPGITGNWGDPTPGQGGHGFQIEILPNNGMLAIWFAFTPDGSGPTWIYSQGTYTPGSNTVTLPAYISQGPKFPPHYSSSEDTVSQWGTLTFSFADCNNGSATWHPTAAGYTSGTMPISRVTLPAGLTCP